MAKTYLQLINLVHGYLRGPTVATIDADPDTTLIANFVNQAKERVEGQWKWNLLRYTITFPSVAGTRTYDTSDLTVVSSDPTVTNDRSILLFDDEQRPLLWDVTSGGEMRLRIVDRERALHQYRLNPSETNSAPDLVSVYRAGNGLTLFFPIAPSGVRNYSGEFYIPQAELAAADTSLVVPWRPVVMFAAGLALEERGDEFGMRSQRFYDMYEEAIAEEIAFDQEAGDDMEMEAV